MDMDTLKMTLTITMNMPRTVLTIMVQPLVVGTISTLQTTQTVTGIPALVVVRTPVPTATITFGQETMISVQMS